jgi:hypothetical protein
VNPTPRYVAALALGLLLSGAAGRARAADADACRNPFFPAGPGGEWVQQGTVTTEVKLPAAAGRPAPPPSQKPYTRRLTRAVKPGPVIEELTTTETPGAAAAKRELKIAWSCTAEGLRAPGLGQSFPMAMIDEAALASDEDVGVDLPQPERWKVGASWTRRAERRARPDSGSAVRRARLEGRYTIAAKEAVSVPAGRFEAFRVEGTLTLQVEGPQGETTPFSMTMTNWYAPGVGAVKTAYRSELVAWGDAGENRVIATGASELQSYAAPAAAAR